MNTMAVIELVRLTSRRLHGKSWLGASFTSSRLITGLNVASLFIALFCLPFGVAQAKKPDKPAGCEVAVISEPQQALVSLDNSNAQMIAPAVLNVLPGRHLLVVSKDGYNEARRSINIEPSQLKLLVELKLEPVLGLILIHSSPMGANVAIDDAQRGRTPLLLTDLPPGRYRVRVTKQDHLPSEKILEITGREPKKLDLDLRPDSGSVAFDSTPQGASVSINGAQSGQTPCTIPGVPTGRVQITLTLDGYKPHDELIKVQSGAELKVNATLEPKPAGLEITSIPDGATIYVSNENRGKAPVTIDNLQPGDYRIRAEMPGFDPLARTVSLVQGQVGREEFRLDSNTGSLIVTTMPGIVRVLIDNVEKGTTKADPNNTAGPSLPVQIDGLAPGSHTVLLVRRGYEKSSVKCEIVKNETASLKKELKKLFLPDILIRVGDGQDDVYIGTLVQRFDNGDVKVELKEGVFRLFKKGEIQLEKPLAVTE